MDRITELVTTLLVNNGPVLILAAIAGAAVFVLFFGLLAPPSGKPRALASTAKSASPLNLKGIQASLDKAQIEVPASEYLRRSLTLGIPVGIGLFLMIGSIIMLAVGILAGFMLTWTKLEQERDRTQVRYTKQLASACDTIRTAYGVNPSLKKALEAVAEYGQSPVKEDFQEILVAASQERFVEGLQQIADRRRSIVFDTVSTTLIRASEASGEVGEMLVRLADSTRQNVGAFEDALNSQLNARSAIQWGTYGPWLIFCIFRVMTAAMAMSQGESLFAPLTTFFTTPGGNALALFGSLISIFVYRYASGVAQRGLVVQRIASSDTPIRIGQKPLASQSAESVYSAQTRPMMSQS